MRKKIGNALLAFTAAALVLTVNVGNAGAYFTTYVEAQGSAVVHLGDETNIREEVSGWVKHLTVVNREDSDPVYIRARAFCGSQYELTYTGSSWVAVDDGFYLYNGIVEGGQETEELTITVDAKEKKNSFDVVVIYESIPAQYDGEGNMLPPVITENGVVKANSAVDWDKKLDVIESKPKGESTDTSGTNPDEPSNPSTNPDVPPESSESTQQGQEPSGAEQESGTEQDTESDNGGEG